MSEANENFMVIGGKRFDLTPRESKSTKAKSFVKHNGAFFTVTPVAAGNIAVAVAASPVAANAAIPFAADAEAGEITEVNVQELLLASMQRVGLRLELTWKVVKDVVIGDDLKNVPGNKAFFIDWIQADFDLKLVEKFGELLKNKPLCEGFIVCPHFILNWSLDNPQDTYNDIANVLFDSVRPI